MKTGLNMFNLNFLIFFFGGLLLQSSKCQSVKGGSRGVKGGSYSQYHSKTSSSSQQVVEEPIQQRYYSQSNAAPPSSCENPDSPRNGRVQCQRANNRHICTGSCNPGFKFPGEKETMELECQQLSGIWMPYRNFPDCIGLYGGSYDSSQQRIHSSSGTYSHSSSSSYTGGRYGSMQSSYGTGSQGEQSSYGTGGHGYQQYRETGQNLCGSPKSPANGRHFCSMTNGKWTCQGTCNPGFEFPDGSSQITLMCNDKDGIWSPSSEFLDCASGQSLCGSPKAMMNGRHFCSMSNGQWTCQGTCNPGYEFPDGSRQMTLMCYDRDGIWSPASAFPDCVLLCHPQCENGGTCAPHNQCYCPATHRGNRCQYPLSLCDFNLVTNGYLKFDCNHSPDITECRISCPDGMAFKVPTTSLYRCTVDGHWNPPEPPECVRDSLCEQPPPPQNGRVHCQGNGEVMTCSGNCREGYLFPDGFTELVIQCVQRTGEWSPDVGFPDCEPICNPGCENGGKCLTHNKCLCPRGFRGMRCQYPTSNCEGDDRFASVAWSCQHNERETVCNVNCGETNSKLQPSEPTIYTCSLDGTWHPDLKPICVTDYSMIDRRSSHGERYEVYGSSHRQDSSLESGMNSHGFSSQLENEFNDLQEIDYDANRQGASHHNYRGQQQIGHEFGGQQQANYEFGGQQQVDYDFGGQRQMTYDFGGQQQLGHEFGGQQLLDEDDDFGYQQQINSANNQKLERLNMGGYSESGQKSVDYENEIEQQILEKQTNSLEQPHRTRQEEGKEEFDKGFVKGGYKNSVEEERDKEPEIEENIRDIFSNKQRISSFHGICSAWGYHHYRSFDGGMFTFPSACPYILASKCGRDDLIISLLTECDQHAPCERIIEIQEQENTYILSYRRGLEQNGMTLPIPTHVGELTVERITRYLVARLTTGFTIWINDENTVLVVANQFMKNQTCGMCGNFDGYLDPHFIRSDGSKTDDIYSFANSWKRDPDGICVDNVEHISSPCSTETKEKSLISNLANVRCASIYNNEFHSCAQTVNPDIYYTKCQMDCCNLMAEDDCECASISEYVLECSRNGVDMKSGWRTPGLCPMICSNGTEYRECGPPCPPTCDDQEPTCQQERCVDGCHCPKGMVLENGKCVSIDQCPCHHGTKIYNSGETMEQGCNTCVCEGGNWKCTDTICPAKCSVSGPHFETFDGLIYDFSGQCSHYLVDGNDFNVRIDYSNNCRDLPTLTSVCIRSITIHTTEGATVKMKQTMEVSVNGREMLVLPVLAPGIYVGQATSKYIRARLTNGLEVMWDMDSSVQVYAPTNLFKKLKGLCGTFTKNQQDDFLTPEGDVEKSSLAFAQKWIVDENCLDYVGSMEQDKPCDRYPERRTYAARVCRIIKEDNFKDCHSVVDYQRYFEECLEDICGCIKDPMTCSCLSLSNYATACALKGVSLAWRQSIPECGIPCPMGQIYEPCANPCVYSCGEIAHSYSNCREECVEGCICPPGQTLDVHGECVSVSSCSCVHSGHVYPPDFLQRRGNEMCECAQGHWACHRATPEDLLLTPPSNVVPDCDTSSNLEITDCVSECPVTCSNLHHHQPCTTAVCVPGCRCKKDYIMDTTTGKCVKPVDCPCHHSGKSYEEGQQVTMDCHICTCESGTWKCDDDPCPGLCSAWGDSHYETFDGRVYDFEGSCDYVMVKAHVSDSTIFSVVIQNIPCSGSGGTTCGKSLAITLGENSITLTRDHPLPDVPEESELSISSVGMFTLVDSNIGISVQWDRNSRIYIIAQPIWERKLQGLCGDFNSDSSDDFKSASGGIPLVLAKDFADSWRVHKYCKPAIQPEDTCDKNPERRTWSKHKCSVLKSELFKPCHYEVDVEEYFKRCVLDACACNAGGDCECLCAVVSAYAQKCSRRGVVIPWRSQDLCPVQCESCDNYSPCISLCPPPTCDTYLDDSDEERSCSKQPCVDGCEPKQCESGQVHKSATNLTCIPEQLCSEKPCAIIDGVAYREGERIENEDIGDACQSCYCRKGKVECIGVPCTSTTPKPIIGVILDTCTFTGWSDWINTVDPADNNGDDSENLEDLDAFQALPCALANITAIECRVAATQEPAESSNPNVKCDLENMGLQCRQTYKGERCVDYEIRVYCQCHQEVTCPPGQEWNNCAFDCDNLCHSMETFMNEEDACVLNKDCVPGCTKEVCRLPKYARDAETCVTPDLCTCRLSSGYVLAPGEVITDGCEKCQCLNNSLICSTILECMQEISPPIPPGESRYFYESTTPELGCETGWSEWRNLHLPDRKGETESLEDIAQEELISCTLDQVTQVQCRETKTSRIIKYSGEDNIYCDLKHGGLKCSHRNMPGGQTCEDYEIRAYCDCEMVTRETSFVTFAPPPVLTAIVTSTPKPGITEKPLIGIVSTTASCSYWSDWINKGKPRKGRKHGDKEDTRPYILKQTEGFCLEGYVSHIECQEVSTGKDYTETREEKLICDLTRGFHCQNKHQPDGRCQDYKIRYFCTCGEEKPQTPIWIRTTPAAYIYPCTELIPVIDGPKPLSDSQIKASSSESPRSGPDAIKMKSKGRRKAWSPKESDTNQYIEVDLGDVRAIYGIVTKGKEDYDEWITSYQLLFSNDGISYSYYQEESDKNKVFSGNYDDTIEVKHVFSKPFEARYVRLEPLTWEQKISLKMDLLGCAEAITTTTEVSRIFTPISGKECKEPMGLENGSVGVLTASSFFDAETSAEKGRMGSDSAWAAGVNNINQYLQVDLQEESVITGVVTKGRADGPQWVISYMVAYSDDGMNWEKVVDEEEKSIIFDGNKDQFTRVTNEFPNPIKARYIRILPLSWKNKISMQVEILGCVKPTEQETTQITLTPEPATVCQIPMGLENGILMDSQLSASSSYSSKFTPDLARLRSDSVWAAAVQDDNQYLQVDFIDPQVVAGIITKGREDIPQWVTAFEVEFSNDGNIWNKIKDENGNNKEFPGNYDPLSLVENLFPSTIRTRFLRIRPTKWKSWISMQIEILGCYHPEPCRDPMGLENGVIFDHQLTASSELSESHSADNGRLSSSSAWSPEMFAKTPYLQVDLLEPLNLTAIVTKGNPEIQQWVKRFYVAYSNDSIEWKKVQKIKGKAKEFIGNKDQESAVINLFPMAITARYIRVIPLDWHKWISLRMELLGCFHEQVCREPMGLENGVLSGAQITASSSSDPDTVPSHARLSDKSGWQPDSSDKHPYIQVDFLENRNISAVITKGMGDSDSWVTEFKVVISDDGRKWYPLITDEGDTVVFKANEDKDTPVINAFPETVDARYIRIEPLDFENAVGLRLEILGCYHPNECQEPMGLESGSVFDFQIHASSYISDQFSPAKARLDSDTAWVADVTDINPYIQVDFIMPTNLTGIMTRGRNDANEWVKEYKLEYSDDGSSFFPVKDELGRVKVYPANQDNESPVTNILTEPIFARVLRIIPIDYERKASMRFEVLGCYHKLGCLEPMGLENGLLGDGHITASSYRSDDTKPNKVRLNSDTSWMPEWTDDEPFIQVNFFDPRNLSAIVTKGDATEHAWVSSYKVDFSDDGETWIPIEDEEGYPMAFSANEDNESPIINVFPEPIEAKYIKIKPINWKKRISLRMEILGCYHPYEEIQPELTTIVLPDRVLPLTAVPTEPEYLVECPDPMEPEISLMHGAKITASSSTSSGPPSRVLLNTKGNKGLSGGWVPNVNDLHPSLIIELPKLTWITSINIQGREDEENWVTSFRVISSSDNSTWMPIFELEGDEVMEGNGDQNTVVKRFFKEPTEAKYIKIIPETWHKWPSFRMELKGCSMIQVSTIPEEFEEIPNLCPELENYTDLAKDCPDNCPGGQLCDGEKCVDPVDCSCVHERKIFKVSDRIEDRFCRQCDCSLGGHSICREKQCEPCKEGQTAVLNDDCTCSCEECGEDEVLCPSNMECIPKERWCDGIVDCSDDETNCMYTTETTTPYPGKGKSKKLPKTSIPMISSTTTTVMPLPTQPTIPGLPENATCTIMGPHINTFDGQEIIYEICNHVVMKDIKNAKFNVTVHKECGYVSECKHWIEVNYLNQSIKVQSNLNVNVNGYTYTAAQLWRLSKNTKMTLVARKVGEQVIITSFIDGFTVIYDVRGHLKINVNSHLLYKIGGLCGYYSGNKEDDQRKPDGKRAFTSKDFGDSWETEEKDKECKPLICPHEEMSKSMALCNKLKQNPFIPCSKLLPISQFIEICMSTTCECLTNKNNSENKCKCSGLLPFVEACESKLGPLAVRNWRLIHECHTECPPGMEWNDCGPSCQLTCDTSTSENLQECSGKCVPGCFCSPGTVLNDEECIPPDQCRDQVCQGFGDPHFKTFDGLFFPFQAVGSFLIVSDDNKNFEVKGLSKKCGLLNPITCLVGMEITYKQHKILMKKSKELNVDGEKISMDDLPLYKDGMVILGYPGRTFVVVIPTINMEARYYEENSGFAVRIPSRKYFNKTRGLCGNCNGKKDDELKDEPLNEFVCSWQTEGDREDCMKNLEELPELAEHIPICEKLKDPVFGACHPLIDVDIYVDACNFDATHSGDNQASFCKTAMEYGRQCCQIGINIDDWPSEVGCDIECPSGMVFEQCHKGCPQTCGSKNDSLSCEQLKTDGCFCPEEKVLKDGDCVDIEKCETCDEEGHMPGDKWDDGSCKHCHCREDLNVECVLEVCPEKPICSKDETLVKKETERESLSCCESYICVPKEEECSTMEVPKCKTGEVAKVHTGFDGCPYLKCECDPILCAPLVWPEDLEEGQQAILSNGSCCSKVKIVCFEELCPEKPDCENNLELIETTGECCTSYKCKPPKDVCVYTHMFKIVDGFESLVEQIETDTTIYQPGEKWEDGLCEKCNCVESKGQYVPLCIMEHCTSLEDMPDNKDYVLQEMKIPNKCCPEIFKTACRDENGNIYEPGEQWQDEDDPCISYVCEENGLGEVVKTKSVINCTECPRTAVLFPPSKALGQCCGFCKPIKCEDGDEIYSVGETWTSADDSCRKAECVSDFGKVHVVYTKQMCPTIPEDCPPDKIVMDEKGCCRICNLTSEISCSTGPIPESDTIGFFTYNEPSEGGICVNEKPVSNVLQCKGACHSRSYYSLEDGDFKDTCKCCKVNITIDRTIELRCPNGNYITKTFKQPETCQCSKCAPKSKKSTSEKQTPWIQQKDEETDSDFVFAQSPLDNRYDHERYTQQQQEENFQQYAQQQQEDDFQAFKNFQFEQYPEE